MDMPYTQYALHALDEGMRVIDNRGRDVGTICAISLPDAQPDPMLARYGIPDHPADCGMISTIAGTFFDGQRLPDLLFTRLTRTGFVQVKPTRNDGGAHFYVTPHQIDDVIENCVILTVSAERVLRG